MANNIWNNIDEWIKSDPNLKKMLQGGHIQERWDLMKGTKTNEQNAAWVNATKDIKNEMSAIHQLGNIINSLTGMGFGYDIKKKSNGNYSINFYPGNDKSFSGKVPSIEFGVSGQGTTGKMGVIIKNNIPSMNALSGMINSNGDFQLVTALERGLYDVAKRLGQRGDIKHLTDTKSSPVDKANYLQWLLSNTIAEANSASPNIATSRQKYENSKAISVLERSLEGIGQVSGVISMKGFQQDLMRDYKKVFKNSEKNVVRALDDISKLRMSIADDKKFADAVAHKFPEIVNSGAWAKISTFMNGLRALGIRQGSVSENASGQIGIFGVEQPFSQFEQIHSKKSKQTSAYYQTQPHKSKQQRHAAHQGQIFTTAEQIAMGVKMQDPMRDIYKIADVSEKNITAAYQKLLQKYKVGQKGGMSQQDFRKRFGNNIAGINLGGLLLSASTIGDFDAIGTRSATTTTAALKYQMETLGLTRKQALKKLLGIEKGEHYKTSTDDEAGLITAEITKVLNSPVFKATTGSGSFRGVAQHVRDDELLAEILLTAGYDPKQIFANGKDLTGGLKIQGVQQRTDGYKAKHVYELVGDEMNYIAAEYINSMIGGKTGKEANAARTQAKEKFVSEFMQYMLQNNYLPKDAADFLTWDGNNVVVSNKKIGGKVDFLKGIGAFAASKGYYKENPFSTIIDDKGEQLKISQNLIRGRQIARSSNSVEAGAHGVKWGYREMEGVKRRLGMMRWAGHGAEADILQKYYDELFSNTELSQAEYNKMREEETQILRNSRNAKLDKTNIKGTIITLDELNNMGLALHTERDKLSGQIKDKDKTAAGKIAKLQESGDVYLDPGMIFGGTNAKGEMWNGRLIQLPKISFADETNDAGEKVYKVSSAERLEALNTLLRKVDNTLADEGISDTSRMIAIGDAAEEMFESIHDDLDSKEFDNNSYQRAHRIRMETAGMEMTAASNFNPQGGPYADKTTNAIVLNSKDFRKRLGKNIDKLSAQYEDLYGVEPKFAADSTEQQQILWLQNQIIKASTIGSAEFAATGERGIVGSGNRWPSSGGRDARSFRMLVAASDQDIAEHTMYIDPSLQMNMHGDNDSDKIAEFNDFASDLAAKGYTKDQMKKLLAARRAEAEFEALETQYIKTINQSKIDNGEDQGFSTLKVSEIENLNDAEKQEVELFYTKYGKKFTGIFSSIFQGFTQAMLNGNLDEATLLSGDDAAAKKNAVAAMLVRSLFRAPTENAISAKKAAELLNTSGGSQKWYNKLDELQQLMVNPLTYSSKENMELLLSKMQEMGILDEDNEHILKSGGDNYLDQIIGQILTTPDGAAILAEFAGATDVKAFTEGLKSGSIHVSKDMLLSGLMHVNSSMAGVGGKGVSVNGTTVHGLGDVADNIYKFIPGYGRNPEYYNTPAYTDLTEDKITQIQHLADALGVAEDASKREAAAEKDKIGIANSESAAIQKLAKEYNNLQNSVTKSAEAYDSFDLKRHVSPHKLLEVSSPYVMKGKVDTTGFLERLNQKDLGPYFGYTEEEFIQYRDKSLATIMGKYATGVADLMAKNSKYGAKNLQELYKAAGEDQNLSLINDIAQFTTEFEDTINKLFPDKSQAERQTYIDLANAGGAGFYQNIAGHVSNTETDSFATEVELARFDLQRKYNQEGKPYTSFMIDSGSADAIISTIEPIPDRTSGYNKETHSYNGTVDAHIIEILDNKFSVLDAPISSWILQIMDYAQMLKNAAAYIKTNKISSKEAFANSAMGQALAKEGALDFVLNQFDALSDPNVQFRSTIALGTTNPKSKNFGKIRNFSLDSQVIEGKDARANAIYQKFNTGEVITKEEEEYLEGRMALNTRYAATQFAERPVAEPVAETKATEKKSKKKTRKGTGVSAPDTTWADYQAYARQYAKTSAEVMQLEGKMDKMPHGQREIYQDYLQDLYERRDAAQGKLKPLYDSLSDKDVKRAQDLNAELDKTLKKVYAQQTAGAQNQKKSLFGQLADGIKMSMQRMFSFGMVGYKIVGKFTQSIQKVIAYAQQLDQVMVNIQIVTGKTRDESFELMDTYNKLAKQMGSTTSEVANSANVWFNESRDHIKPL